MHIHFLCRCTIQSHEVAGNDTIVLLVSDNGMYGLWDEDFQPSDAVLYANGSIEVFIGPIADEPVLAAEDILDGLDDRPLDLGVVIGRMDQSGLFVRDRIVL